MPRSSSRLVISAIVATAWVCWVMPIAQHTIVRWEPASIPATRSSCGRWIPVASTTVSMSTERVSASVVVEARGSAAAMKSRSITVPGRRSSASTSSRPRPVEQGQVAAEADLDELVGDRHAVTDHPADLLRVLEPDQAGLG